MTKDTEHMSDVELEDLLTAARNDPPALSEARLSRITQDGLAQQTARAATFKRPQAARARSGWSMGLRIWPALSGLAACLVLGVSLGAGFSPELLVLSDFYLTDSGATDAGLWSFDTALEESSS